MSQDIDKCWEKIRDGDERALEIVFQETYTRLCHYSSHLTGDIFLSQEIVQDVLLKIWQNRSELTIHGLFGAYLFQMVHNQSLNALRSRKTIKQSVNHPGSEEIWQFIATHYDVEDTLVESIFSTETEKQIQHVVDELPEQCRRVFRMSRFDSMTNEEIAATLEISENTVKTHIHRALQKITHALGKDILKI